MKDLSGETTPEQDASADGIVVRRSARGWQVGDEQAADLTSAMVLADLLAADLGSPAPTLGPPAARRGTLARPARPECRGAALESWQMVHGDPSGNFRHVLTTWPCLAPGGARAAGRWFGD